MDLPKGVICGDEGVERVFDLTKANERFLIVLKNLEISESKNHDFGFNLEFFLAGGIFLFDSRIEPV
jgi:hypothetical protein